MTGHPLNILIVDDDPGDIELTKEAMKQATIPVKLHAVGNGQEALYFLRKEGAYAQAPHPDLILLDLNMPVMDGRELLHVIKRDQKLKIIPVVVLTTSEAQEEIERSYGLGANCYVTKPVGLEQFSQVVRYIEEFWLTIVKLPIKTC